MLKRVLIALALIVLVGGAALSTRSFEPFIGFPGAELSGTERAKPSDWSNTADVGTVQLETRPGDPYSINIWGVGIGPDFYVATSPEGTAWSREIEADPDVRLRVGDGLYALKAVEIRDEAERKRVFGAYLEKYDYDDIANTAGRIYRLDAR